MHGLASAEGLKLVGVAPSRGAAGELGVTGIESQIVAALLTAADKAGARVLLVGDTQQLKAVSAGKPLVSRSAAPCPGGPRRMWSVNFRWRQPIGSPACE